MKNIGPAGVIGELVERIVLLLPVDKYIAISETTKEKLVKAGVKKNKIEIVYCGVDEEEIEKVHLKKTPKKYDLSSVSRLVAYKRISDLISAIHLLLSKHPKITAAIIGQGPEKKFLEEQVRQLGLADQIIFFGHVKNHASVLETISSSKIFCFPTSAEGFGIAPIEAAALGVPSVLSSIPVLKEISHNGESGLVFEKGDPNDLAKKIELLMTDNALYQKKSKAAINLSKQYSWEKISGQTLAIYKELLK
jgi:glycosyltransferase involved in cell wall biosynthesis